MENTTWLDYVVAIGTLLASVGALAAVGLTLYLNIWRDGRRRPTLTVKLSQEAFHGVAFNPHEDDGPVVLAPIEVENAPGKKSAHRVEILLSTGYWLGLPATPGEEKFVEIVNQDPLTWWISDPPQGVGQASAEIPPGVTRKAVLLIFGHCKSILSSFPPEKPVNDEWAKYLGHQLGVFPVVPLTQETAVLVDNQLAYELRLTVVGEDLDAVSYRTRLRWSGVTYEELRATEPSDHLLVYPEWDPLISVDSADWPGPPPKDNRGWVD